MIKHLEELVKVLNTIVIFDSTTVAEINDFCKNSFKETYDHNERIVFVISASQSRQKLIEIQLALNDIDIGNDFVVIVSTNDNILDDINWVTKNISFDPQPAQYFNGKELIKLPAMVKDKLITDQNKVDKMNLPHNKFCVLPWISVEASPFGTIRPCCMFNGEIVNDYGIKFDLNNDSLKTAHQSEYMNQLRLAFLKGIQPVECNKCWEEEKSNRTSKRMNTILRLSNMLVTDKEWTTDPKDLMFLDLKLGNICNIACRICGSWSSSTYAGEELRELPLEDRKDSFPYKVNRSGNWPRKSLTFWDELHNMSSEIRYIEFTGGEPFMIQEHFDFLQYLIDHNYAKDIEVHYNTNTTLYPNNEDIWKPFKHVEIAFSIDDLRDRFEYQRYGADWHTLEKNLERFKKLRARNDNITLQVCSTVNVFNVMYLEELANWIDVQGFDFVYWNMLHDAPQHCVTSLPKEAKLRATERLLRAEVNPKHYREFKNIAFFMNSKDTDSNVLRDDILRMDKRREQNMRDYLPELAECLFGKA